MFKASDNNNRIIKLKIMLSLKMFKLIYIKNVSRYKDSAEITK